MDAQLNISRKSKPGSRRHKHAFHERCQLSLQWCESLFLKDNSSAETTIKREERQVGVGKKRSRNGEGGTNGSQTQCGASIDPKVNEENKAGHKP